MSAIEIDDYADFCDGLRRLCGIDLSQYKRPQMERRLRAFFARRGVHRLSESLDVLRRDEAALEELLERITINVSQLWRHPAQWAELERGLLAEVAASGRLSAWSAGCSYGAEVYTLAAVCASAIPGARVRILGTDIDRRMIARAATAEFTDDDARGVPEERMRRGFERIPGGWRARPELRRMARFEVADLLRMRPPARAHDLILCRNTVIYFAAPIRDTLHRRLAEALRPGGLLVVGATERVCDHRRIGLEAVRPFIYRRA